MNSRHCNSRPRRAENEGEALGRVEREGEEG